ncbi:MAG: cellulose synthase operon protein YhjQ/BcsQ [Actinomycetota bacterium]
MPQRPRGSSATVVAMTRVAIVTADPLVRDAASRAFEGAPSAWSVSLEPTPPDDADVIVWGPDTYRGTGILLDPSDPARAIASIDAAGKPRRVIVVSSAGGGQGATTVAAHLAAVAGRGEAAACLIDAEPGSSTRFRIGIPIEDSRSWADAEEDLLLAALPTAHGFRALLAPPTAGGVINELVARSALVFDRVIVDAGSSTLAVPNATRVLVMSPTIPAAHRARRNLWMDDSSCIVVTNRLGRGGETSRPEFERILEARIAVELPHCPGLRDGEDDGKLICHSFTRWWWSFKRLVDQIDL